MGLDNVVAKVESLAKSSRGKRMMRDCIKDEIKKGKTHTQAGSALPKETTVTEASNILISILKDEIDKIPDFQLNDYGAPPLMRTYFNHMKRYKRGKDANGTTYDLYFTDDLSRESLYPQGYPGGLKNIVALFNNGYDAKNYVFGEWKDPIPEEYMPGKFTYKRGETDDYMIRSRKSRPALNFMQKAVDRFNSEYGYEHDVVANVGRMYAGWGYVQVKSRKK